MTVATRLQVLIATVGRRIENIPPLPVVPGVAYLIGWQKPGEEIPEELAKRADIKVMASPGIGLSRNRNFLFENATAELLLISDDDLIYEAEALEGVIRAFDSNPECQLLTFRHAGTSRTYPDAGYDLLNPPKGTYTTSFEIALRRNSEVGNMRFDERFGIGGTLFSAAEDDLFMLRARQARIPGQYLPLTLCTHPGPSTGQRIPERGVLEAWGAYIALAHPAWQWPLRLYLKALRLSRSGQKSFWPSLRGLLSGLHKLHSNP